MARSKLNGYALFVQETYNRRILRGELIQLRPLYAALDHKWRALSDEVRQEYKDRAKTIRRQSRPSSGVRPCTPLSQEEENHIEDVTRKMKEIDISEMRENLCENCKRKWGSLVKHEEIGH